MSAFESPLADPGSWTLAVDTLVVPAGLRYQGSTLRALRCTRGAAATVAVPAAGVLRRLADGPGEIVEVQVNPFPIRDLARALRGGVPTFYLRFDTPGLTFTDGHGSPAGEPLQDTTALTFAVADQDLHYLDPAFAYERILTALTDLALDPGSWQPFVEAAESQTASGPYAPVLLLDAAGQPLPTGRFEILFSPAEQVDYTVDLEPADGGDLQQAIARLHAADPQGFDLDGLWGPPTMATAARLRPLVGAGEEVDDPATNPPPSGDRWQLARFEDGTSGAGEIVVSPSGRHVSITDLHRWFAPQFAVATGETAPRLARFHRDSQVQPFLNGKEFFDDLFAELNAASSNGTTPAFHLLGLTLFADDELTERPAGLGENDTFARTVKEAAELLAAAGGGSRFLASSFFHVTDPNALSRPEIFIVSLLIQGAFLLGNLGLDAFRLDGSGSVALFLLLLANPLLIDHFLTNDVKAFEPNEPSAVDPLSPLAGADPDSLDTLIALPHLPATIEDNPVAPPDTDFPFDPLFQAVRHFGFYHQKIGLVWDGSRVAGYCGGIDVNPNRLDDVRHLVPGPYHDVHAKVEGPAAKDLVTTFEERWAQNGNGAPAAFTAADVGTPSPVTDRPDIVQIGRTYPVSNEPSRQLDFAPAGDRTLCDTLLRGLASARELVHIEDQYMTPPRAYRDILIDKVASGALRKVVIVFPGSSDQLFGDIVRLGYLEALRTADDGRGIVHVSTPRRRYTLPKSELRSSSGKLILDEDLPAVAGLAPTIALGPVNRLPPPPFWVAVEGELMWVYDEATVLNDHPAQRRIFAVERGADTRLLAGGANPKGPTMRAHAKGAAATVVELRNIYIHAKVMIVDDVFLSVGSANLNRRGHYHDAETNVFTLPHNLRLDPDNPVAHLRRRLWAEMMDLPLALAEPLLRDPEAAAALFQRSYLEGNRFVSNDATPAHTMLDVSGGDGIFSLLIDTLIGGTAITSHGKLFDGVVDPTTDLDPHKETTA